MFIKGKYTLAKFIIILITFAANIWAEPLSGVVVQEAFSVGEPHGEVARVAGVLQDSLQGEGVRVGRAIVG